MGNNGIYAATNKGYSGHLGPFNGSYSSSSPCNSNCGNPGNYQTSAAVDAKVASFKVTKGHTQDSSCGPKDKCEPKDK